MCHGMHDSGGQRTTFGSQFSPSTVGSGDPTQVTRLGKHFYLLSNLANESNYIYFLFILFFVHASTCVRVRVCVCVSRCHDVCV